MNRRKSTMRLTLATAALLLLLTGTSVGAAHASPRWSGSGHREASASDWTQVSAGRDHTCGIRTTGRLYCWGDDTDGQLGNGPVGSDQSTPVQVAGGATTWASVSSGGSHTCALRTSGRLYCWGSDHFDQLGDGGGSDDKAAPVLIGGPGTTWSSVDTGRSHTCAIDTTGLLRCWGLNVEGQAGTALPDVDTSLPVPVAGEAHDWASVSAGDYHTCARKTSGRVYCWGRGAEGQIGDSAGTERGVPVEVTGGATDWALVSAGGYHTCARKTDGRLFCWGNDVDGQTGSDTPAVEVLQPLQEATGGRSWAAVSTGGSHTCARKTTGRLYCWGDDDDGEVGDGAPRVDHHRPTEVSGAALTWGQVSAGGAHTCARRTSGRLFCWGSDDDGEVGEGPSVVDRNAPIAVL